MSKFSLKKAKAGKDIKIRSGKDAKILLFDRDSRDFPIVAIIENKKIICCTSEGRYYKDKTSDFDLLMKD